MKKAFSTPLHDYLLQLPEATLDYPFGPDTAVYRLAGKIFAIVMQNRINLKCDPAHAQELRTVFRGSRPDTT